MVVYLSCFPGSCSKSHAFPTDRHVNPLVPMYALPHSGYKVPIEPSRSFIRDTLDVRDIDGAQTQSPSRKYKNVRESLCVSDVVRRAALVDAQPSV